MDTTPHNQQLPHYREILREELESRCQQNPRYSLRAFARDLELAPSRLSEILSGKQGLSRESADSIAKKLGYSAANRDYFCDLVGSMHARSKVEKEASRLRLLQYRNREDDYYIIPMDAFKIISEWYHLAIVELTKIREFNHNSKWIAKRLGIQPIQAELAIERLVRLNILRREGDKLVALEWNTPEVPSEHIRKFHRQILEKAMAAMTKQPIEKRYFTSSVIPIAKSQLADAKDAIWKFQHGFCTEYGEEAEQGQPDKDAVYCLAIQFFGLTEDSS